uniref:Uncharacterized protein n=1 Tax=Solanum lycopersicum TaxID=4081 RepID=A0A3Q7FHF4_SOLLC
MVDGDIIFSTSLIIIQMSSSHKISYFVGFALSIMHYKKPHITTKETTKNT